MDPGVSIFDVLYDIIRCTTSGQTLNTSKLTSLGVSRSAVLFVNLPIAAMALWGASSKYNCKDLQVHHLGFFDSEEAAAKCYDAAVMELRGPTASTNFEPTRAAAGANPVRPSVLQQIAADPVAK